MHGWNALRIHSLALRAICHKPHRKQPAEWMQIGRENLKLSILRGNYRVLKEYDAYISQFDSILF
jgi:hypothetical protein